MSVIRRFCAVLLMSLPTFVAADPPYDGTVWTGLDLIRVGDPTAFVGLEAAGTGARQMFDRRVNDWVNDTPFLFTATFSDGLEIEVQVNSEFGSGEDAEAEVLKYATAIGQLPTILRRDVETVWIHKGYQAFGGGNNNLMIHTEQGDEYRQRKNLEEALFHEATHTSMDGRYGADPAWRAAQASDGQYISTYAQDNPEREDMAESFLLAFAVTHYPKRVFAMQRDNIVAIMPARIAFFETLLPAGELFTPN